MDSADWRELVTPLILAIAFGASLGLACFIERITKQ